MWLSLFSMKSVIDLGNNVHQELPAAAIVTKFTPSYACILTNHKWKSATTFCFRHIDDIIFDMNLLWKGIWKTLMNLIVMFISIMSQVKKVIYFELSLSKGKLDIIYTVMTD